MKYGVWYIFTRVLYKVIVYMPKLHVVRKYLTYKYTHIPLETRQPTAINWSSNSLGESHTTIEYSPLDP